MKILLAILLTISCLPNAKAQSGVYMSFGDYNHHNLSYTAECTEGKHIYMRDFFRDSPALIVKKDGKKYTLKKNDLYGYRDCDSISYRFYKNKAYRILEPGNLYIYQLETNLTQGKNFHKVLHYFFSVSPESEIMALNVPNLEEAYKNNEKFEDLLDQFAKTGDVTAYDQRHRMYRINYLVYKSLNEK
jgi:hypothetical protein